MLHPSKPVKTAAQLRPDGDAAVQEPACPSPNSQGLIAAAAALRAMKTPKTALFTCALSSLCSAGLWLREAKHALLAYGAASAVL